MNLLAFDTSTEALSAAVQKAGALVAEVSATGGAHASASLIPVLQSLLARAGLRVTDLDAIVFGRGPGSFTGLRTACAVAQGFGFAANVPVLGVDTLHAIAEDARARGGATHVVALLDARMHEVYAARYAHDGKAWTRDGEIVLTRPEALDVPAGWALAGNAFGPYGGQLPSHAPRIEAQPSAAAMLRIAPHLIAAGRAQDAARAMPVYIRDKVAQTTEERAAARAAPPLKP
ncbi:MAG TPA: tRNA (adenosine(37)-N6)-threonylcarbamoyltransferase complex dimerization subunit type 1 TsaB [Ramlibacter sp.]